MNESSVPEFESEPADYPTSWEFDGLLVDGGAALIRPVRPGDEASLARAYTCPTFRTRRDRRPRVLIRRSSRAKCRNSRWWTMTSAWRSSRWPPTRSSRSRRTTHLGAPESPARVAFVVDDAFQHRGVATLLFESLVAYAYAKGIDRFTGDVLAENTKMLNVLASSGLNATSDSDGEVISIEIDLHPTAKYRALCDERDSVAEAASMSSVLCPRSVAVVGAGRKPGGAGHEVVRSLLAGDFSGTVYPVNPSARAICGVPAFSSLSAIPEQVDLAIIAVPATGVLAVLEEAAAIGVRAVTVITAGFAETGRSGADAEAQLLKVARRHGMRIVGPNCLGLVNTDPETRLNATFTGLDPRPGRLALASQSGAVGIVLAEQASAAGLGISNFVSVGNKLDVTTNDLLCFFERDERTSVIALYLESFGNPRRFARIARRVGAHKPIVVLKAGRTSAGARGARSHTAAAASPEVTVTALLKSAGIIKVDRLEEMLDVSAILLTGRLPGGRRVALVGNSGGPLILAADACEAGELLVPELSEPTRNKLKEILVPAAALANPVDLTADGTGLSLAMSIEIALNDDMIDAVIVVVTDLVALKSTDARAAIARVAARSDKPVVACLMGTEPPSASQASSLFAEVPSPERAAAALDHVCRYAQWRRNIQPVPQESGQLLGNATIREIVATTFEENSEGGWLELEEAARLLEACGVPVLATRAADSADEAADVATVIGFPVVLKARSGALVHKSDVGGVVLNLGSADAVRAAYQDMSDRLGSSMGGAVIQAMVPSGVEAIIGLAVDPSFGPVVMVGLGGVMTDLLGDHAFAVPPLDPWTGDAMVASLRAAPLLDGYRGAPKVDRAALVSVLELIAKVAEQVPELVELDLNPVVVSATGALVVDCKARLAPSHAGPGPLFRAMRSSTRE